MLLVAAGLLLSACVSDTLSTVDTQPQPIAQTQETPDFDPIQREQAIAEIRDKAAQPGSGELTNAFAEPDSPNEPMTPQEQAARIAEMERSAERNSGTISDAELAEKQRSIRELQEKAKNHYGNALNTIQN